MNAPVEIVHVYAAAGVKKTQMSAGKTVLLAMMAGAFIALAGVGATIAAVSVPLPSVGKLVGACVFPAGLAMVLVAGSELFTGNNLLVLPLLRREITLGEMLRNWGLVYLGNLLGALLISVMVTYSGTFSLFDGGAAAAVVAAGKAKVSMTFVQAMLKGILCNFLVCIAVWMAFAATSLNGKIAAVFFPVMLFVLCGFEHSVADMYYVPAAILTAASYGLDGGMLGWDTFLLRCLLPVTLGNIIGGAGFVGTVYWAAYGKKRNDRVNRSSD